MKNIPPPLLFWPRDTSLTSKGKEETLNKLNCSKKEKFLYFFQFFCGPETALKKKIYF